MAEWVLIMLLYSPTGDLTHRQIMASFQTIEQCKHDMKLRHEFLIKTGAQESKHTKFICSKVTK